MNITAEICVIPMGAGVSVSRYIAACQPILEKAGLNPVVHAYGTNVEGEWDDVFASPGDASTANMSDGARFAARSS